MHITFYVQIKESSSWNAKFETERKEFEVDLPDGLPIPDMSPMVVATIRSAVQEYNNLRKAAADEEKANGK